MDMHSLCCYWDNRIHIRKAKTIKRKKKLLQKLVQSVHQTLLDITPMIRMGNGSFAFICRNDSVLRSSNGRRQLNGDLLLTVSDVNVSDRCRVRSTLDQVTDWLKKWANLSCIKNFFFKLVIKFLFNRLWNAFKWKRFYIQSRLNEIYVPQPNLLFFHRLISNGASGAGNSPVPSRIDSIPSCWLHRECPKFYIFQPSISLAPYWQSVCKRYRSSLSNITIHKIHSRLECHLIYLTPTQY